MNPKEKDDEIIELTDEELDEIFADDDFDNDGRITISDALMTMRYAMGTAALTDTQILAADFDGNGTVSITDATMILRAAMIAD